MQIIVESVAPLTKAQTTALKAKLNKAFGDEVEMVAKINRGLIAGLRITTPEVVVDKSVASKLEVLKYELLK